MKKTYTQKIKASALICFLAGVAAMSAKAQTQYFQPGGGSWDGNTWSANAGNNSGPFTSPWVQGNFARFDNAGTYTVTVGQTEQNTGIYNMLSTLNLTINDDGSGNGNLDVTGGIQGFLTSGTTTINVPITGNEGIAPELSGSMYLNAVNTYSGGTALGDSGNTLVYFNNNSSFGTGGITLNRTGIANFSTLLSEGSSTLTIANNFSATSAVGTGTALNFASSAPVVSSGTWTLGTYNLNLRNAGGTAAPLTISGAISGSGILALSGNGTGSTTIFSGANSFNGQVIVTGVGGTYGGNGVITLKFGANNVLASATQLTLSGGKVAVNGTTQSMAGTLGLTSTSTIDFGGLGGSLSLANSSGNSWTGALDLTGYTSGELRIGTDNTGITTGQENDISINGGTDNAYIDSLGYIDLVPEPSTLALGALGGLGMLWMVKRRKNA